MNIGALLTKSARLFPNRIALVCGDRALSYAKFNSRVNQLANVLRRLGVRKKDNVALLQYNCPETLESLYACFKAGCAVVPINWRLHPKEFAFIINHSNAKVVI